MFRILDTINQLECINKFDCRIFVECHDKDDIRITIGIAEETRPGHVLCLAETLLEYACEACLSFQYITPKRNGLHMHKFILEYR